MLAKYVVASSYQKMYQRISHNLSQPYMTGLRKITHLLSSANYQQLEPLTLTSRDKIFLMSIQQVVSHLSHDASECKDTCKFDCNYKLQLPRLAGMAEISPETPMFYTRDTLVEYHRLLVNLLEHFKHHLRAIKPKNSNHHHFNMVRLFGSVLYNMVSSRIMVRHMENIENVLWQEMIKEKQGTVKADSAVTKSMLKNPFKFLKSTRKTDVAEAGDGDAVEGEGAGAEMEEEEGFDDAMASIQLQAVEYEAPAPGKSENIDHEHDLASSMLASRSCQWLRLMTTYFDAMDRLLPTKSTRPQLAKKTTIHYVALKHQGNMRMDWEKVLLDYLPTSSAYPNRDELVADFKMYLKGDERLSSWFGLEGTFRNDNFSGTRHCEAIASALMYLKNNNLKLPVCISSS
jgi:hypothetical protein